MKLRKSIEDIPEMVVEGMEYYSPLWEPFSSHYVYLKDCGHSILAIPLSVREATWDNPDGGEVAIPVRYVLENLDKVWVREDGEYLYIDVEYDGEKGVVVDDEYYEYSTSTNEKTNIFNLPDSFIIDIDDNGMNLLITVHSPAEEMKQEVQPDKPFEIKFVRVKGVMMFAIKFGDLKWLYTPYTVHASERFNGFKKSAKAEGLDLNVNFIDLDTFRLVTAWRMKLGKEFTARIIQEVGKDIAGGANPAEFRKKIDLIRDFIDAETIVELSSCSYKIDGK